MAPVLASRLPLLLCLLHLLFLLPTNCYALLFYDRQTLLDIRISVLASSKTDAVCFINEPYGSFPSDIQDCLRPWPLDFTRRKRRRKRGKRQETGKFTCELDVISAFLSRFGSRRATCMTPGIRWFPLPLASPYPSHLLVSSPTVRCCPHRPLLSARSKSCETFSPEKNSGCS